MTEAFELDRIVKAATSLLTADERILILSDAVTGNATERLMAYKEAVEVLSLVLRDDTQLVVRRAVEGHEALRLTVRRLGEGQNSNAINTEGGERLVAKEIAVVEEEAAQDR